MRVILETAHQDAGLAEPVENARGGLGFGQAEQGCSAEGAQSGCKENAVQAGGIFVQAPACGLQPFRVRQGLGADR